MVMVTVPVVALLVVAMVSVDDPEPPLTEAGLKLAVAPEGKPLAFSVTVPVFPLVGLTLAVELAGLPAVTVTVLGDAASEKSAACVACTTKLTRAVCVRLPLVPVTVRVYVPAAVVLAVETFNVEEPEPVTEVGFNVAVTPAGAPLTLSPTAPLKLPLGVTFTV